jgi:hypothetical protein
LIPIDIDGVADALKSVEGDAYRKDDVEKPWLQRNAEMVKQDLQIFCEKIEIFKKPQYGEVTANSEA